MNKKRQYKLLVIVGAGFILTVAASLVLFALRQNISLYLTPQQVLKQHIRIGQEFRLGGLVRKGSVRHFGQMLSVQFVLTDFHKTIRVKYRGILPSLFREGQGIVADGHLNKNNVFVADQVLAKHDANYHPPGLK